MKYAGLYFISKTYNLSWASDSYPGDLVKIIEIESMDDNWVTASNLSRKNKINGYPKRHLISLNNKLARKLYNV